MLIINPGTERNSSATLANAEAVVNSICRDIDIPRRIIERAPSKDRDGWFCFQITAPSGGAFEIEVPGDDPETVCAGKPFVSRRLYVDGSSWLYGYALDRIAEKMRCGALIGGGA